MPLTSQTLRNPSNAKPNTPNTPFNTYPLSPLSPPLSPPAFQLDVLSCNYLNSLTQFTAETVVLCVCVCDTGANPRTLPRQWRRRFFDHWRFFDRRRGARSGAGGPLLPRLSRPLPVSDTPRELFLRRVQSQGGHWDCAVRVCIPLFSSLACVMSNRIESHARAPHARTRSMAFALMLHL